MTTQAEDDAPLPGLPASQRLFSEEVGIASADNPQPLQDWNYEFSNGRRFFADPKAS